MKHTICLRSVSQPFPLPLLVSVSMPLQGQSKVTLTSSVTGWVCRLQRCSKFLRHQENWAQLASHQWDPVQLTHDRSVTQCGVLIYSFFRNADMQGCVWKALNTVSNSGSRANENKSPARLRPNKNRLASYFRSRTLKNVGSVLSESSLRPKVGHGKIKTGPQITLEKKLMSELIGYAMLEDPWVSSRLNVS